MHEIASDMRRSVCHAQFHAEEQVRYRFDSNCFHHSKTSLPSSEQTLLMPQCKRIAVEGGCFTLLQDDLLHPVMGGNKMRKLDALVPVLHAEGYTDVVGLLCMKQGLKLVSFSQNPDCCYIK